MSDAIELIVGLGNIGEQYTKTRHNAGFWFIDALCDKFSVSLKHETKYKAEFGHITINGKKIFLLKPLTFMNKSGESVQAVSQFYKIPLANILVAHDELDIPTGAIKLKRGGGHGGHNGLRDIIAKHGNQKDFARLRIGIDHPGQKHLVSPYVLSKARPEEAELIDCAIHHAIDEITSIVENNWSDAQQKLHRLPNK